MADWIELLESFHKSSKMTVTQPVVLELQCKAVPPCALKQILYNTYQLEIISRDFINTHTPTKLHGIMIIIVEQIAYKPVLVTSIIKSILLGGNASIYIQLYNWYKGHSKLLRTSLFPAEELRQLRVV